MEILSVNFLSVYEISILENGQEEKCIVFYDNSNQRVIPIGQISQEKKFIIENFLSGQEDYSFDKDLKMPNFVKDSLKNIKEKNYEYFGMTSQIKRYSEQQQTEEK